MTAATADNGAMLMIEGAGIEPDTVDASSALELAASYFSLLAAKEDGLSFRGLQIVNKCTAFRTVPSQAAEQVRAVVRAVNAIVSGKSAIPHGLVEKTERVRDALDALPTGARAEFGYSGWVEQIKSGAYSREERYAEQLELRVVVRQAGGREPRVRVANVLTLEAFSVRLNVEQAQEVAVHLYNEIDLTVRVERDPDGRIRAADYVDMVPVSKDRDPEQLRRWFQSAGGDEWNDIDDVEGELGRGERH